MRDPACSRSNTAAVPAIPDAKATDWPPSKRPTISSSASHVGVPSSRAYARSLPRTKFEASTGGTFNGEPGRRSRPAATSSESAEESPVRCGSLLLFMSEYLPGHSFETGWSTYQHRLRLESGAINSNRHSPRTIVASPPMLYLTSCCEHKSPHARDTDLRTHSLARIQKIHLLKPLC